jgi:hypothetical protein
MLHNGLGTDLFLDLGELHANALVEQVLTARHSLWQRIAGTKRVARSRRFLQSVEPRIVVTFVLF